MSQPTRLSPPPTKPTKAVVAALTAVVGSLAVAVTDGSVTLPEWLTAIGAGLLALGSVYQVTNNPRDGGSNADSSSPSPAD